MYLHRWEAFETVFPSRGREDISSVSNWDGSGVVDMNVWCDFDAPAPMGWRVAKSFEEIQRILELGPIEVLVIRDRQAPCDACNEEHGLVLAYQKCGHGSVAQDFFRWMDRSGLWPTEKITIRGECTPEIRGLAEVNKIDLVVEP